jgi:bifunctional non-homologous end joining protein LigD
MSRVGVRRSQRQHVLNSPALRLARELPGVRPAPFPDYIEPLLATQWDHPPPGDNWVHEIKYDGYRLQISRSDAGMRAYTRRGYDWAPRFPTITATAAQLNTRAAVLDGEVVVVTPQGDRDFSALESYVSSKQPDRALHNVIFYAFDLLHLDGFDLRDAALIDRKCVLACRVRRAGEHSARRQRAVS